MLVSAEHVTQLLCKGMMDDLLALYGYVNIGRTSLVGTSTIKMPAPKLSVRFLAKSTKV